jgi:hypothetical protein
MAVRVPPIVWELQFERCRLQAAGARHRRFEQNAAHRAGCPCRTDEVAASKRIVQHVVVTDALYVPDVVPNHRGSRALEEPGVEFEAPDGMLHARNGQMQAADMPMQPPEAQEAVGVAGDVQPPQIPHDLGSNPAGAKLLPRKLLFVEDENINARRPQPGCRGGARRAAADDDDLGATQTGS